VAKKSRTLADIMARPAIPAAAPAPVLPIGDQDERPAVVAINVFMTPGDRKRLRQLSIDSDTSIQKLAREGLDLMLERRGLAPLEPATANTPSGLRR
jgi:hypothetical protein